MAARWLPNHGEFFYSLGRLIDNSERQENTASYDSSEYLARRLDEYERTLSTLIARLTESETFVNVNNNVSLPSPQATIMTDLTFLFRRLGSLRSHFEEALKVKKPRMMAVMSVLLSHICLGDHD